MRQSGHIHKPVSRLEEVPLGRYCSQCFQAAFGKCGVCNTDYILGYQFPDVNPMMHGACPDCTAKLESDTAVHVDRDDDSDSNDEVA